MFSGLADLAHAWVGFMNPTSIALGLGGALLGIIVGILPGLSATLVIALLTTITIKLPANDAILVLICSYVGALYGGSRTAILLNIPGTAANAASCADGYALAQRGEAGRAIGIATSGRLHRHAVRRDLPGRVHALARRGGAGLRRLRVLLARPVRRGDVRLDRRRRSGQGLADGRARPVRRPDRPGGPLCLRPLHLRLGRARRRHRPDPGAGRRLRPGRGADRISPTRWRRSWSR